MNFVVDIGNSVSKIAFFENGKLIFSERLTDLSLADTESLLNRFSPSKSILSSVKPVSADLIKLIERSTNYFHLLSAKTALPFAISYKTPDTLGPDRIAAVAGGHAIFPGSTLLIIDAGSAITYEILDRNTYLGGNISPGINMRFRSLNYFTGSLPLVEVSENYSSPGDSTTDAIRAGVVNGVLYEINEYIRTFEKKYSHLEVILTGGDCLFISKQLGKTYLVRPELVTEGLNFILDYNAQQDF